MLISGAPLACLVPFYYNSSGGLSSAALAERLRRLALPIYLRRRIPSAILAILVTTFLVFVANRISGDPAALMIDPLVSTEEDYQRMREYLGLDKPIAIQYVLFLTRAARGDFGTSYRHGESAMRIVLERLPATLELTGLALLISVVAGVPLGILSAVKEDSVLDYLVSLGTLIGQAMPNFWLGILLILILALHLRLVPTSGRGTPQQLILPVLALAAAPLSKFTRLARSGMLEVLSKDYIRTARGKGLGERRVLLYHALRNASIDLITVIGMDFGRLMSGMITVETVFGWPGMGRLAIAAVQSRDFTVIQADVVVISIIVVTANLVADLLCFYADPRIRAAA